MRAQVIDLDPETNPKLKEILDLLLLAGYFRIRIPSITPFDKILGGLSWCITQSNFAIDIQYSEEFNIGQKIKVSEKIVKSLEEMSSPYKLQPHQIQGLDLNGIYPVIKWLIKFVLETREFRQDQNARVSKLVGKNSFQALQLQDEEEKKAIKEVVGQLDLIQDQRQTKNLKTLSKRDPLRVYSTLIEYGDLSSQKTYNKFCAAIAGIQKQKQTGGKQQQQQQLFDELTPAAKKDNNASITLEQLTNLQKERSQQTQAQIKEMTQAAGPAADSTLNEEEGRKFQKLGRRNSITGQNIQQLISKDKIAEGLKEAAQEEDMIVNLKVNEKQIAEQQLKLQQQSLVNVERMLQQEEQELHQLEQVNQELEQSLQEETQRRSNILEALKVIEQKSKKANLAEIKKAEEKVQRIQELKEEKKMLKKEIKQEAFSLEKERDEALNDTPEDDGEAFRALKQEYNLRKEKYEKKFLQFQQLNQEIAVLERKMESYPQLAEIAQYHQRFFELYDSINEEMEANKKQFMRYNNVQELKQLAAQFVEIMRTFKENYNNNLKDKKGKQELSKNLDQTYAQLQQQTSSYVEKVKVLDSKKNVSVEQYRQMLNLERDYFRLLKEIKFEYEKNEQMNQQQQQQ